MVNTTDTTYTTDTTLSENGPGYQPFNKNVVSVVSVVYFVLTDLVLSEKLQERLYFV